MNHFYKHIPLLVVFLFNVSCSKQLQVADSSSKNEAITSTYISDSISEAMIAPYRLQLKEQMDEVLNTSLVDMEVGSPEGLLGNFVTDLIFWRANYESPGVDFALLNNGGLRVPIHQGDITRGKIYELMPFDNEIVIVELSGAKMLELIEYVKKKSMVRDSRKAGVPVSGLRMNISNDKVTRVFVGIKEFDENRNYKIATSDYLANGGDHMDFFLNPVNFEKTGVKLRDAIIDYIVNLKKKDIAVNAALDGRIYHAE